MIGRCTQFIQQWVTDTVRSSAIRGLSETVEGKRLKKMVAPLLAYIVVAAVLIGQLLLVQWPQSFAAFLLASPLITNAILAGLAIACQPSAASKIPLYACIGFGALAALQCIMGAFAMCLPVQPGRTVFALLTSAVVLCLCLGVSGSFVKASLEQLRRAKKQVAPKEADLPPDDSSETSSEPPSSE